MIDSLKSGDTFESGGQQYRVDAIEPYTRKFDGAESAIVHLVTSCATCGKPFKIRTGRLMAAQGKLNRRCKKHHMPGIAAMRCQKTPEEKAARADRERQRNTDKCRRYRERKRARERD